MRRPRRRQGGCRVAAGQLQLGAGQRDRGAADRIAAGVEQPSRSVQRGQSRPEFALGRGHARALQADPGLGRRAVVQRHGHGGIQGVGFGQQPQFQVGVGQRLLGLHAQQRQAQASEVT